MVRATCRLTTSVTAHLRLQRWWALHLVGYTLMRLELILAKLVDAHGDDVLLHEDAGLAMALAIAAIGDGRHILDAFLAC